jgi:N-acetylneuraminic acid mutarotase
MLVLIFAATPCVMIAEPISATTTVENSWKEMASMDQARGGLGVVAVDGAIFAIGGSTSDASYPSSPESYGFVGTNEEYNITTGVWTYKAPMPIPRDYFAIAAYQDKIYCIGGQIGWAQCQAADNLWGPTMTSANEVYDIATNTWEDKAPMPVANMNLQTTVINGEILVKGPAYKGDGSSYIYNITANSWSLTTAVPFSSWYQTEGAINYLEINVNGKELITDVGDGAAVETTGVNAPILAYVIGSNVNEVYDPAADNWTKVAAMPTSRGDFGLAVANDLIYAIGGFISGAPSAVNEQYTPIGYGTPDPTYVLEHVPPTISLVSPANLTYGGSTVPLIFGLDKRVSSEYYSLDGQQNVTIAGNTTLTGLSNGLHNIIVYANDTYGNIGASQTAVFNVVRPEPFPTVTAIAVVSVAAVVGVSVALLVYSRKHNHR